MLGRRSDPAAEADDPEPEAATAEADDPEPASTEPENRPDLLSAARDAFAALAAEVGELRARNTELEARNAELEAEAATFARVRVLLLSEQNGHHAGV